MAEPKDNDGEDLSRLVEHLTKEEDSAAEATLTSIDSLQLWVLGHPGLQQPGIFEMINNYGPAILQVLRRLIGL